MTNHFSPKNDKVIDFIKAKLQAESTKERMQDLIIAILIGFVAYFPINAVILVLSKKNISIIITFIFFAFVYFILRFRK